jgi:hypothetical protein
LAVIIPICHAPNTILIVPLEFVLNETQRHEHYVDLQDVIAPYYWQLDAWPESWPKVPIYGSGLAMQLAA